MITSTNAFRRLKIEQQRILDFAVLTCHAIPNLSKTIKGIECSVKDYGLASPLYFQEIEDKDRLKALINHADDNLAKYILISSWSFFEYYFKDVMTELLLFYGGEVHFLNGIKTIHTKRLNNNSKHKELTLKTREPFKASKKEKYKKYLDVLDENPEYTFSSELFSMWGAKHFVETIAAGNFVSADIPYILRDLFGMDMSEKLNDYADLKDKDIIQTCDSMRSYRNKIGHGEIVNVALNKVMAYNKFLRKLALIIDSFLIENYFILNNA